LKPGVAALAIFDASIDMRCDRRVSAFPWMPNKGSSAMAHFPSKHIVPVVVISLGEGNDRQRPPGLCNVRANCRFAPEVRLLAGRQGCGRQSFAGCGRFLPVGVSGVIEMAEMLGWMDPVTLGAVGVGAFALAAMRARKGEVGAAFAALGPLFRADPTADAEAAMRAVRRVEAIAEAKSLECVDRVATTAPFLREAVVRLSDSRNSPDFARWAAESLAARDSRHHGVIAFWATLADGAPAMGMIATVLGLVRMFAHLDDPRAIGAPMASALLATLLGLILANVVAGPIAARLERLHEDERAWQVRVLDHFTTLAREERDAPPVPAPAPVLQRRLQQKYAS
jgi:chemotaxis protein MotA